MSGRMRLVLLAAAVVAASACAGNSEGTAADRVDVLTCGETGGETVEHDVDGLSSRADTVLVHVPPCYDSDPGSYPTLWLMHGGGTTADMWVNQPIWLTQTIDALMVSGEIAPVIVAMPNGASGRPEFLAGEFEIVLADVDAAFRTIDDPRARAIAGVSAGGTTAAYLAAENTATDFAALGLFMTVWGPTLTERFPTGVAGRDLLPDVLVDIGEDDGLRTYSNDIQAALDAAGVTAETEVHPGGHDGQFIARRLPDWLRWLALRVGA
ncbi:MAG: alpha/beta hydrolase [Ilumatobacter sp.]